MVKRVPDGPSIGKMRLGPAGGDILFHRRPSLVVEAIVLGGQHLLGDMPVFLPVPELPVKDMCSVGIWVARPTWRRA
jgi:hypothetical protein